MKRVLVIFCWIAVWFAAAYPRFQALDDRPFHFDEATGARITSQRFDPSEGYRFDPTHFHGPVLSAAAMPVSRLAGEHDWKSMTKRTLRLVPALAGTLLVLVPLLWRRRFGDVPMLAAAALLASSPLLVYYSRMYIHEMLLSLLGLLALVLLCRRSSYVLAGVCIGLMFATKETFAISVIAWTGAGVLLALVCHRQWKGADLKTFRKEWQHPVLGCVIAAGVISVLYYSGGLKNFQAVVDAVKTYFVYETTEGHDKPFGYYLEMLAVPTKAGVWWHELPVLVLALLAVVRSFLSGLPKTQARVILFLAFSIVLHLLIYSLIDYKTPWLMCLPWAQACLLSGLCLSGVEWKRKGHWALVGLVHVAAVMQFRLSHLANGRFSCDPRNPYAYAPTSRDVESLEKWLAELSAELPPQALEPIGVVGSSYWPLPWYLREFDRIGYWPEDDPALAGCPVVMAMPETAAAVADRLESTHVAVPRGLRSQVPLMVFLRKDHWEVWME